MIWHAETCGRSILSTSFIRGSLDAAFGYQYCSNLQTAVLRVLSDILLAVDRGDVAALIILDLSAAFNTVDYEILLQHLQTTYGISDVAHRWYRSYLLGRSQYVRIGTSCSSVIDLIRGVPQGSVLGPVLFILYTAGLISLIESHGLTPHLYADDTQARALPLTSMHFPPSSLPAPVP